MSADPADLACPVHHCGKQGERWVTLHDSWTLACCAEHADDIEHDPEPWRVTHATDGVLRIAKAGKVPAPEGWD